MEDGLLMEGKLEEYQRAWQVPPLSSGKMAAWSVCYLCLHNPTQGNGRHAVLHCHYLGL